MRNIILPVVRFNVCMGGNDNTQRSVALGRSNSGFVTAFYQWLAIGCELMITATAHLQRNVTVSHVIILIHVDVAGTPEWN